MIKLNASLFIQMANFLLLLILLNFVLFRPIRSILKERREKTDLLKAEALDFRDQVAEIQARLAEIRRQAQAEGAERHQTLKREAEAAFEDLINRTEADLEKESAAIKADFQGQFAQARQDLLGRVDQFSRRVAERILSRSLS